MKKLLLLMLVGLLPVVSGCIFDDDDDGDDNNKQEEVQALEAPFLICASRNPGGVGFDFVSDRSGVAYNMDEAPDLEYDLLIKTVKAEKPDCSLSGAPYADLYGDSASATAALAFEASTLDNIASGLSGYDALGSISQEIIDGLAADAAGFSLADVAQGESGAPLYSGNGNVAAQYKKLLIGEAWKATAKNAIDGDEQVWVIRTREGRHVKLIVWEFPAKNAPTETGYVNMKWELLD